MKPRLMSFRVETARVPHALPTKTSAFAHGCTSRPQRPVSLFPHTKSRIEETLLLLARRVRSLPYHATMPYRLLDDVVSLLPESPQVRVSRVNVLPLFPADNLFSFRDSGFNYSRITSRRSPGKRSRQVIALRTHIGRVARHDVRERDTWWAQVTLLPRMTPR